MGLERGELIGPEPLGLLEPVLQFAHRPRFQRIDPDPRIIEWVAFLDQAAGLERAQVPAERRRAQTDPVGQLAGRARRFAQQLDDLPAMRIGERGERAVDRGGGGRAQENISILRPVAFSDSSTEKGRTFWAKVQTWPSGSRAR